MKKNLLKKTFAIFCATAMLNTVAYAMPRDGQKVPVLNGTHKAPAAHGTGTHKAPAKRDTHKAPATHDTHKAPATRSHHNVPAANGAHAAPATAHGANHASTTMDSYHVHTDDTLWRISKKYGVHLDEVITANPQFADPDLIYPGETVHVPLHHTNHEDNDRIGASMADNGDKHSTSMDSVQEGIKANVKSAAGAHEYENIVAQLVNAERAKQGLAPLTFSSVVSNVARVKSEDMKDRNYFSHQSPTYGGPFEMMKQFGVKYKTAGENIAKGQKTPEAVMNAWMNSEGHRKNIMNPNFKEIGVGYVTGSGTTYWTQQFIAS